MYEAVLDTPEDNDPGIVILRTVSQCCAPTRFEDDYRPALDGKVSPREFDRTVGKLNKIIRSNFPVCLSYFVPIAILIPIIALFYGIGIGFPILVPIAAPAVIIVSVCSFLCVGWRTSRLDEELVEYLKVANEESFYDKGVEWRLGRSNPGKVATVWIEVEIEPSQLPPADDDEEDEPEA